MKGHLHPLTQFMRQTLKYFTDRGFSIAEGDQIDSEWWNFDALNVPATHPSRDVQDTFWLKDKRLLRTQTTTTEAHLIGDNNLKPPFRLVVPGRCFRHEATDATHDYNFYQLDGIAVDKNIGMDYLIGILDGYMKSLFGNDIQIRFRPHLFPFVEPGLEVDVKMPNGKWREMLGAGMAHPVVLKNIGINPEKWQGIMWGPGVDRYMMYKFGLDDIRVSNSGDLRFLKQF
ncbi:MAG: Phenylalanine-tRNA ligase alpha subunit [Berkelbacteria bacterium GW2011_GWB1_38_5]|uniref:phenylalanine--tRNA ligase n=2 Tax=Candidatus Berkelbacteria TaxID=1618330 RepID=A0A0G0PNP2_9BACT|nr:MAG: Phenylalanine-tRNA ligase alpha subunit [Berkelbacteria bacterium GW2011_GWB1_38_5]KKQ90941.1 MAG: Phenylalanine-tRNA ligase alpha subunit [Berkelbacteria bacterium GW2011_GWA1_39_10]